MSERPPLLRNVAPPVASRIPFTEPVQLRSGTLLRDLVAQSSELLGREFHDLPARLPFQRAVSVLPSSSVMVSASQLAILYQPRPAGRWIDAIGCFSRLPLAGSSAP